MRTEAILDVLTDVDARHPTDEWRIGEIHSLPLFRYEVYNTNYTLYERTTEASPIAPSDAAARVRRLVERGKATAAGLRRWTHAQRSDRAMNAKLGAPVDAVLYSDGVSFVERLGKQYDRFLDPVREQLRRSGASSVMLTPIDSYLVPRYAPSAFIQPAIDRAHLRAIAKSRLGLPAAFLPGYEDVTRELAGRGMAVPSVRHLQRITLYLEEFATLYTRMLQRLRPRVVYIVAYYGSERFAMVLAARRLGIPVVDIQHGYSGELHWAYTRWDRVPRGGYEILPDYFWCWTEGDRQSMGAWADRTNGAHRVLVGGILFQEMWKDKETRSALAGPLADDSLVARYDARVRELFARHPHAKGVLYTASGFETPAQLEALAATMRATAGEYHWYFRMHPCRLENGDRIEAALRAAGARTFDLANATQFPLYALLRHVSLHLTESSSTVIEAAAFGVPSVLWGTLEAPSFRRYIANGWLLPAPPEEVPEALRKQLAARDTLPRDDAFHPPSGLADLLALATEQPRTALPSRAGNYDENRSVSSPD